MKNQMRICLCLFCICLLALSASAQKIDRVIFFGDSLSDAGNHFIYSNSSSRQPFSFGPPEASYDIGGHHYSNGNTWAEQLASSLHTPTSGNPSLRAPGLFTDYAVGRARARANAPEFPFFDLSTQVNQFLTDFHGQVPENSLVVIWIGGNDIDDALNALNTDPSGQTSAGIIGTATTAVATNVGVLYGAGARMFLIVNVPDFAKTPYVQFLGANVNPAIPGIATLFTGFYDDGLAQLAVGFPFIAPPDPVHPLQFVRLFDVNALFSQILETPATFGITNIKDRCTRPGIVGGAICSTPNRYLFWDGIHPTSTTHAAVANAALQLLPAQ
jgi:phospholipase/lecithinase/hemolysin